MYYSASRHIQGQALEAWRTPNDESSIWFGVIGSISLALSDAEVEQAIELLQRELAAKKAEQQASQQATA